MKKKIAFDRVIEKLVQEHNFSQQKAISRVVDIIKRFVINTPQAKKAFMKRLSFHLYQQSKPQQQVEVNTCRWYVGYIDAFDNRVVDAIVELCIKYD